MGQLPAGDMGDPDPEDDRGACEPLIDVKEFRGPRLENAHQMRHQATWWSEASLALARSLELYFGVVQMRYRHKNTSV